MKFTIEKGKQLNIIKDSFSRAWNYCSSYENFHYGIFSLENYFKNNGYSSDMFWYTANSFVNNKFVNSEKLMTNSQAVSLFIRIPYSGNVFLNLVKLGIIFL